MSLPLKIQEIIKKCDALLGSSKSTFDGGSVYSLEDQLNSSILIEEDQSKKTQINYLLGELNNFFKSNPTSLKEKDFQIKITSTKVTAYLTLISARGGKTAVINEVIKEVERAGIIHGVNYAAIKAACDKIAQSESVVVNLAIAEGKPPSAGRNAELEFLVEPFNKEILFEGNTNLSDNYSSVLKLVESGSAIANISQALKGESGIDVEGHNIIPVKGKDLKYRFGNGVKISQSGTEVVTLNTGSLLIHGDLIDIVPFYVVKGDLNPSQDINFNGNVLVVGNVKGPVNINCEDLFVIGNLEKAQIAAHGDIFIQGGIVGKKESLIECEGRLFAKTIADCQVVAFSDVIAGNYISYSDIFCVTRVIVKSEKGTVLGGEVCALNEVVAKNIGSDFGTFTSIIVGKDFLNKKVISMIDNKIMQFEQTLVKINHLKQKVVETGIDITHLPPEKQDLYLSVMKKEKDAMMELSSLKRRKMKLDKAISGFINASVKIIENLHPPMKIQIENAVQEINQKMEKVGLILDQDNTIRVNKLERF